MKKYHFFLLLILVGAWVPASVLAYGQGTYYAQVSYYHQGYYQSSYAQGTGGAVGVKYRIFTYTGSAQSFTVPSGVTSLRVVAIGGGGGGGSGAGGYGSGGGGGCGGVLIATTATVTPGHAYSVTVGAGGVGGNGLNINGGTGQSSSFGSIIAPGGSWGRTGYYNLNRQYAGGSGGGSGSGGGGNAWPAYYSVPGSGGTAGGAGNNRGAGGWCTGSNWPVI